MKLICIVGFLLSLTVASYYLFEIENTYNYSPLLPEFVKRGLEAELSNFRMFRNIASLCTIVFLITSIVLFQIGQKQKSSDEILDF